MSLCLSIATWTTPVSLQPLGWHSITASSLDEANRSLPSIEGSGRLAGCWDEPIQCHLRPKTLDWHRIRIVRVPPLKIFLGPLDQWEASILSSRPIRGLDFSKISGISQIWDHPMNCHCATAKSLCHWRPTWNQYLPMDIHNCQWTANSQIPCHLNHSSVTPTTWMQLNYSFISWWG